MRPPAGKLARVTRQLTYHRQAYGVTVTAGLVVYVADMVVLVADGQGKPPEVVTDTFALVTVSDEAVLLHVPETFAELPTGPTALHVCPRMLAVAVTPFGGTTRWAAVVESAQNCQVPLPVTLALKVKPEELTVQLVKVGGLGRFTQPQPAGTVTADALQVVVDVPSLKVTKVDDAVEVGDQQGPADAAWALRPSTAATKPRVMRIWVAFITATPVGGRLPADATAWRSGKAALSGYFRP